MLPPVTDAAGQGAGGAGAADQFRAIQERLRQLGATYYLLESWGNQQQLYRFYCKMAVGGSAQYTRCFEATHAERAAVDGASVAAGGDVAQRWAHEGGKQRLGRVRETHRHNGYGAFPAPYFLTASLV